MAAMTSAAAAEAAAVAAPQPEPDRPTERQGYSVRRNKACVLRKIRAAWRGRTISAAARSEHAVTCSMFLTALMLPRPQTLKPQLASNPPKPNLAKLAGPKPRAQTLKLHNPRLSGCGQDAAPTADVDEATKRSPN